MPPYRGVRYHLSEFYSRTYPSNDRELYNLRHSSLRVTIERAFGALKNMFRILDNKPFHTYKTQVKLVLACCILHNWILSFGIDEVVPTEEAWVANPHVVIDNQPMNHLQSQESSGMAARRDAISASMWANRGTSRT